MRRKTKRSDSASGDTAELSVGAEVDECTQKSCSEDQKTVIVENSGVKTDEDETTHQSNEGRASPDEIQVETDTTPVLSDKEIAKMLLKAASLPDGKRRYPIFRHCISQTFTSISKALVVYSSKTKPREAVHLFDPRFLVPQAYRTRNERKSWLFLLNLTNSQKFLLDEENRLDLAKKMTTVMKTGLEQEDKVLHNSKVAWIVGFWLSRLYVEHQGFKASLLPKELRKTRNYFLEHFGKHFEDIRIMLPDSDSSEQSDEPQREPEPEIIESLSETMSIAPIQHSNSNEGQDVKFLTEVLRSAGLELVAVFPSKQDQRLFELDTLETCEDYPGPGSKRPRLELGKKEGVNQGGEGEELRISNGGAIGKYLLNLNRTQAVLEISRKINGFGISLMEAERDRVHEIQERGESILIGRDVRNETLELLREVGNWVRDFHGDMLKVMEVADGKDAGGGGGGGSTCIPN